MPDGTISPYLGGQLGNHAIERAWERYGVRLTYPDLVAIEALIAGGKAPLVRRDQHGQHGNVHMVKWAETVMLVVYRNSKVVTVLCPERPREHSLAIIEDTQPRSTGRGGKRFKSRRRGPKRRAGNDRWGDEGD